MKSHRQMIKMVAEKGSRENRSQRLEGYKRASVLLEKVWGTKCMFRLRLQPSH